MKPKDIAMLVAVVVGAGVLANFVGFGASAGIIGGLALIGFVWSDYGKKAGVKKDWQKGVGALVGLLLIFSVPVVSNPYQQGVGWVTSLVGGLGIAPVSGQVADTSDDTGGATAGTQPTGAGTSIITTTSTLTVNVENALNKSRDPLNPSGFYSLDGSSYKALSFSSGSASVASLDPFATIPRTAVGTDGTFYWEIVDNIELKGSLSPVAVLKVVRVPSATSFNLYSTIYQDLTAGTTNLTVGAGGNQKGFLRFEVTSAITGIRAPVLLMEYNTSAIDKVSFASLTKLQTCPSKLITTDAATNGIQECYDFGQDWFVSADSKKDIPNTVYGFKDHQYQVDYVSGINPQALSGSRGQCVIFHVVDRDKFYRNADPNTLFALDPELGTTDLGYTTEPTTYLCVA